MSVSVGTEKNLKAFKPRMMDGEEPTEVLLALVLSPVLALRKRGLARIYQGTDKDGSKVLAVYISARWDSSVGRLVENGKGDKE